MAQPDTEARDRLQHALAAALQESALKIHADFDPSCLYRVASIPIMPKILEHLGDMDGMSCRQIIERVRGYVASSHAAGIRDDARDDYPTPSRQIASILASIQRYHAGLRNEPVGLHCQAAMLAMAAILHQYGIDSRETAILSTCSDPDGRLVNSHAILEVLNTDTGRWELHDAIFDVGYAAERHGTVLPVSASEYFSLAHDCLQYVHGLEDVPNGEERKAQRRKQCGKTLSGYYFPMFSDIVVSRYLSLRASGMINMEHVDMRRRFPGQDNRNIVEFLNSVYRKPILLGHYRGDIITLPSMTEGFELDEIYPEIARDMDAHAGRHGGMGMAKGLETWMAGWPWRSGASAGRLRSTWCGRRSTSSSSARPSGWRGMGAFQPSGAA